MYIYIYITMSILRRPGPGSSGHRLCRNPYYHYHYYHHYIYIYIYLLIYLCIYVLLSLSLSLVLLLLSLISWKPALPKGRQLSCAGYTIISASCVSNTD